MFGYTTLNDGCTGLFSDLYSCCMQKHRTVRMRHDSTSSWHFYSLLNMRRCTRSNVLRKWPWPMSTVTRCRTAIYGSWQTCNSRLWRSAPRCVVNLYWDYTATCFDRHAIIFMLYCTRMYRSRYSDVLRAGRSGHRIPVKGQIIRTRPDRPWGPQSPV